MAKEKFKLLYILVMAIIASSFGVYATNTTVPDGPDKKTRDKGTESVESSSSYSIGMPSPHPERAMSDHNTAGASLTKPNLYLNEDSRYNIDASPIAMTGKAMPASFRGSLKNEILGRENLNAIFNEIAKGQKTVRILQIGDSHVRGNTYPQTIQKSLEGKLNSGGHKSVSFDFIGINGARASKFTSSEMLSKIAAKRPDLVIISFGTNEAHGKFSSTSNTRVMEELVNGIRKKNPNVAFLITTTPGSYISDGGSKVVNRTHEQVAQNLIDFGRKNGIAVWDLYHNIGGNEHACQNLVNSRMMQNDRIHLTHEGYRMIGNMFSEAFIDAYNQFLKR